MTPEEQKEYWISDDDIVERFEAEDIGTTDDESSAIYVLRNGTMIDGGFQSGCRGEDHACVEHILPGASRYSGDFWEEVFARTKTVLRQILAHDGPMFGASAAECGNYRNLSMEAAKVEAERYLAVLEPLVEGKDIPPMQQ